MKSANARRTEIARAATKLFLYRHDKRTEAVMSVVDVLIEQLIGETEKEFRDAGKAALEQLRQDTDAFTFWVVQRVRTHYRRQAYDVLGILPATAEQLNKLADDENWCSTYEKFGVEAFRAGLITSTREVVLAKSYYNVPPEYEARQGETWEVVCTLPAIGRNSRTELADAIAWSTQTLYRKVSPAPDEDVTVVDDSPF